MQRIPTRLVRLRPRDDTIYASQNRTVLAVGRDGFIEGGAERGLFVHQTRMLSRHRYLINGKPWQPVALANIEQHSWLGYYLALPPHVEPGESGGAIGPGGKITQATIELRLSRFIGDGFHEDVDLTNFSREPAGFVLQLEVDADFADPAETKGKRLQLGKIERFWRAVEVQHAWELHFDYHAEHKYNQQGNAGIARLHRGLSIHIKNAHTEPVHKNGVVTFQVQLAPQEQWHACLDFIPHIEGKAALPLYSCRSFEGIHNDYDRKRHIFLNEATSFIAPETDLTAVVTGALEQAKRDLAALRIFDLDSGERAWTVSAGLPVYLALFGRDTLTASWQSAVCSLDMMPGTLAELARLQGTEHNDWRDEQYGRMVHMADSGPLSTLHMHPMSRYYGSITTSGFYPVVASELWHWTGDQDLVRPFVVPALNALKWLDRHADFDGDGFYEYQTKSQQGLKNQGWKDSDDAIVDEDGAEVKPPIATCEEQGFVYLAKLHFAEVLWWLDEKAEAQRLYREAGELKKRFNSAFWVADQGVLAMALDSQKRQIKSLGSNAGHCLATAIVDEHLVERIAARLMSDEMFTGWGIRTLSAKHPAFNPYSYHRGSVWPVEQGTFALAFLRYGLHRQLHMLCRAQFEAAALFDFYRLPELFAGHQRDADHPFPAMYPQANSPQAWSSSAVFCLLQALLGLYPYAPLNMLIVDPHLPEWLPEMTLRNLHVGKAVVTMRFYRKDGEASDYEVLDKRGTLHVIRQPSPWSFTANFGERLKDALTSLLPGK